MGTYRAFKKGYLKVSDGHKLYYEVCGSPKGKPALFLHGGPGTGFVDEHKKVFDPKKQMIILFDQRGSARSRPFASLKANNTHKIVSDIKHLLDHLHVEKALLHGGSWGSTLALVYAIQNPHRVSSLLLRGVFLSTKDSYKYYMGGGVGETYPEAWQRFLSHVPKKYQKKPAHYYARQIQKGSASIKKKYAYEWTYFELSIAFLEPPTELQIKKLMKTYSYKSLAKIETHFIENECFLPANYIVRNLKKIHGIPMTIVHGRYDMICRPREALQLAQSMDAAKLVFVQGGHAGFDPSIKRQIKTEMKKLINR